MRKWIEVTAKTVDDAITEALIKLGSTRDKVDIEVIEKESSGFLGLNKKPARIRAAVQETLQDKAVYFLEDVFKLMEIQSEIAVDYNEEEKTMNINIVGEDMGVLIGKRGQTLDSLQYLVSLVVNKESEEYIKVKLDTENYRERRKETLENLAKNIAYKVKKTRKSVALEPMNPYERRIIHSALQNDKFVETHSEGEEPYRKIVVTLKKGVKDYSRNYGYNKNSYRKGGYGKSNYRKRTYQYGNTEETATPVEKVEEQVTVYKVRENGSRNSTFKGVSGDGAPFFNLYKFYLKGMQR